MVEEKIGELLLWKMNVQIWYGIKNSLSGYLELV
jgi:hypothetical protein